jgi:hypothetical protein
LLLLEILQYPSSSRLAIPPKALKSSVRQTVCRSSASSIPDAEQATASSEPPPASSNPQTYCTAYCDWKSRCSTDSRPCEIEACAKESDGFTSKWRDAYVAGVNSYFGSLACDRKDDDCIADFSLGDPAYPEIPVVQACLVKRTECSGAFADDYCSSLAALTDAARADAESCQSKPCDQVRDCLKAAGAFSF